MTNQDESRTLGDDPGSSSTRSEGPRYDRRELRLLVASLDRVLSNARMLTSKGSSVLSSGRAGYAELLWSYRRQLMSLLGPEYPSKVREMRVQLALGA